MAFAPAARAQDQAELAPYIHPKEPTSEALCFTLRNSAPYKVYGSIITEYYTTERGVGRKNSNFRLAAGESQEFCSHGPFYGEDNDELELVLRTLVPIFSCKFPAYGELMIYSQPGEDGSTKTLAACGDASE